MKIDIVMKTFGNEWNAWRCIVRWTEVMLIYVRLHEIWTWHNKRSRLFSLFSLLMLKLRMNEGRTFYDIVKKKYIFSIIARISRFNAKHLSFSRNNEHFVLEKFPLIPYWLFKNDAIMVKVQLGDGSWFVRLAWWLGHR